LPLFCGYFVIFAGCSLVQTTGRGFEKENNKTTI